MGETAKRTIFLTGATGLVGSYLLKILLKESHKVFVLSRVKAGKGAKERVIEGLNFWDRDVYSANSGNLVILEGDISQEGFGLKQDVLHVLYNNVEEIFHSAAITIQNLELSKIREVNVNGTKNVLEFALNCKKLFKVNHLSTAYVCGDCNSEFKENDLVKNQKFNSTYEQSKFEGEQLVSQYRLKGLWVDIFRPPLIIGESLMGKINEFKNLYQFLSICKLGLFDRLPVKGGAINFIPVDTCSQLIYSTSILNKSRNKNFHVFFSKMTLEELLYLSSQSMSFVSPSLVERSETIELTAAQRVILRSPIFAFNFFSKLNYDDSMRFYSENKLLIEEDNSTILKNCLIYFKKKRDEKKSV